MNTIKLLLHLVTDSTVVVNPFMYEIYSIIEQALAD